MWTKCCLCRSFLQDILDEGNTLPSFDQFLHLLPLSFLPRRYLRRRKYTAIVSLIAFRSRVLQEVKRVTHLCPQGGAALADARRYSPYPAAVPCGVASGRLKTNEFAEAYLQTRKRPSRPPCKADLLRTQYITFGHLLFQSLKPTHENVDQMLPLSFLPPRHLGRRKYTAIV